MTQTAQNFTMWAGDTKTLSISVQNSAGNAQDITGATFNWALKIATGNRRTLLTKSSSDGITITNATAGTLTVAIVTADTRSLKGTYTHELEMTDSAGNISTVLTGTVTINESIAGTV